MNHLKIVFSLFPIACCLLPLLPADRAEAISQRCWEIRRSRQILRAEGLDDRNLAILERRYCRRNRHSVEESSTCSHLTIMAQLAGVAEGNSGLARMVAGEAQISCSEYTTRRSGVWRYPNGQVVKFGSLWQYPNGQQVRTGRDWRYPNGEYASFGSVWKYPNGVNARFGGIWYTPNGDRLDRDRLLSWGCTYVSREECDRFLRAMQSDDRDRADAALVALAWQAYRNQR
ncbi:MAG: hypothetical protein AAGA60_02885 [Cyanobacteria bacterium P01_E01_bin.42]